MRQFTSRNDVFCDVLNAKIFRGKQVIKPSELERVDPKGPFYDLEGRMRELERDVVKFWRKGGVILSLLGLESQTQIDPDMVFRMFAYDGLAYREQLLNKEETRRFPVVSFVLYYGTTPWTRNLTLREAVEFPQQDGEALAKYFNDYALNLIDMTKFEREDVELYSSDFRFFSESHYFRMHPDIRVPTPPGVITDRRTTADVVAAVYGNEAVPEMLKTKNNYQGEIAMSAAFADLVEKLEKRGEERKIPAS